MGVECYKSYSFNIGTHSHLRRFYVGGFVIFVYDQIL